MSPMIVLNVWTINVVSTERSSSFSFDGVVIGVVDFGGGGKCFSGATWGCGLAGGIKFDGGWKLFDGGAWLKFGDGGKLFDGGGWLKLEEGGGWLNLGDGGGWLKFDGGGWLKFDDGGGWLKLDGEGWLKLDDGGGWLKFDGGGWRLNWGDFGCDGVKTVGGTLFVLCGVWTGCFETILLFDCGGKLFDWGGKLFDCGGKLLDCGWDDFGIMCVFDWIVVFCCGLKIFGWFMFVFLWFWFWFWFCWFWFCEFCGLIDGFCTTGVNGWNGEGGVDFKIEFWELGHELYILCKTMNGLELTSISFGEFSIKNEREESEKSSFPWLAKSSAYVAVDWASDGKYFWEWTTLL